MAERIKDEKDRLLESMFESATIADAGFSKQIVRRIRRRLWIRRITLPVAAILGCLIAFRPVAALVYGAYEILQSIPDDLLSSATIGLPSLQLVVTGGLILFVIMLSLNMLEE